MCRQTLVQNHPKILSRHRRFLSRCRRRARSLVSRPWRSLAISPASKIFSHSYVCHRRRAQSLFSPTTRSLSQFQFVRPALVRAPGITNTPCRVLSRSKSSNSPSSDPIRFPPQTSHHPPPHSLPQLPSLSGDIPSPSDEQAPSSVPDDPSSGASLSAQRRLVPTMPPGRKARGTNRFQDSCDPLRSLARSRDPLPPLHRHFHRWEHHGSWSEGGSKQAEEMTDIERERAETIMRNNEVFQSLGIKTLAAAFNSSTTKSKGKAREEHDPLYEPEDMEETGDAIPDERSSLAKNTTRNTAGTRGSKRVSTPPVGQDHITRITRQRTKELSTKEDALLAVDYPTQDDEQIQTDFEGEPSDDLINQRSRGRSMGKDLDRICRGLNSRMPLVVAKGKRRPEAPMQAAKLSSEGGIILRQHIPIYTHWKDYKEEYEKKEKESCFKDYMGKMAIKFTMLPDDKEVEAACFDLLKTGQRQLRHKLKRAYFGVPANEVRTTSPVRSMTDAKWIALVEMWSSPKHKERCLKNIENRGKVRFAQTTGSRCFIAHTHVLKKNKYKDVQPTAIDLFKDLHCSSKTGFDEPMKEALGQMDAMMAQPTPEGGQPKTPAEVFAQVLPSSKFLQSVGLETAVPKRSATAAARVQELELEVAAEKQGAVALRDQLHGQQDELEALKKKVEESEEAREKQIEEIGNLKKQADETNALLRRLFILNKD